MSEEASVTPLVSHLRQLSCLYQRLSSESKTLEGECKQTGSQLNMLQQLLEGLPNSPIASTAVTSLCSWAAEKLQAQLVLLWIIDMEGERLWTLLPGGDVVYVPFGEEGGIVSSTAALTSSHIEKDVTIVHGSEVNQDLEQRLLSDAGVLPHHFSMIGLVRNEMGERSAVLQAVNSLRKNEENNFIQEDEICMKGILPTVAAVTGLVKAMFEQESALAEAFDGQNTQSECKDRNGGSTEEMKDQDNECVPRDWLIDKLLQRTARDIGAVSCKMVLHDRRKSNDDVGSVSPSLQSISQALEERIVIVSSPILIPGTGVYLGKLLTIFVAENESKVAEVLPSSSQEAFLAEVSVTVGTLLASAFKTFSCADRAARAVLSCRSDDYIGICEAVSREIKLVVACAMVKAFIRVPGEEERSPQSSKSLAYPVAYPSDEGGKNKWVGFGVSGSGDIGVSIVTGTLDSGDLPQQYGKISTKYMDRLLHAAHQSSGLLAPPAYDSASLTENGGSGGGGGGVDIMTTCGVFMERCVVVPLAFGCGIVAVIERDKEDDPFSQLEMSAIVDLGYELGFLVSMGRTIRVDKGKEGQQQDRMVASGKVMDDESSHHHQFYRIGMKETTTSAVWETVRQFANAIPLPMTLHNDCGGVRRFLYGTRSSILPESLVSVICCIVPGCVAAAVYDHISLVDDNGKGTESDDILQETIVAEHILYCRVNALRCILNGTSEWISTQILQQEIPPDCQSTHLADGSKYNTTDGIECRPPPLETNNMVVSATSTLYVPLPGRDAALELACTEESKVAEDVAVVIATIFSTFLAWRDKVTEKFVSSAMRAFSVAVQRRAFQRLAIYVQQDVKLKLELRMENMEAEFSNEREEFRRSLLEMEKERSESCKQQQQQLQSQPQEEGERSIMPPQFIRNEKNHIDIRKGAAIDITTAHVDKDEEDVVQRQKGKSIMEQQPKSMAALENELSSVKLLFSKEQDKLHVKLGELQGMYKMKEAALELQVETLKSEIMVVREEQCNDNNQWQLHVEELQSKLLTANKWHQNSLKENEELQKHVELMSISLRDTNMENAYLHEHFKDLESDLHAVENDRDAGYRKHGEHVQELQQLLCDCTLKLQNVEDEKQQLLSEQEKFVSSADKDNRGLLGQRDELKLQLEKAKNKEDELLSELMAARKENDHFQRNSKDLELKLSTALEEQNAIRAKYDAGELLAKQQLENVKKYARKEIDMLHLKLEKECTNLRPMTDAHTANEVLLRSQIEEIQHNLEREEFKYHSELKMAIQKHMGTDDGLILSEETGILEGLLSIFQSHLETKHSFKMQEREKSFRFRLNSTESHLLKEKAGLLSQLDGMKIELCDLQGYVSILSKEKESTKSKLDDIQGVLHKERLERETQLQKERERSQALEMRETTIHSELEAYKSGELYSGGGGTQSQVHQNQHYTDLLSSSNSPLHIEVGVADGSGYDKLHPAELVSLLKIRDEETKTLAKRFHDAVNDKDTVQAQLQHEMVLLRSHLCDEVATLQSRLTEEIDNRMELSRRNAFSTWHLTAMQLKEKEKLTEQSPLPDNDGDANHLSLMAPPASPHSVSLYHHETSSHYSLVSPSSSSSSTHALLQGLVETLSAPPDFSLPSDLPSLAKCVQDVAMGIFGVATAHLYVVDAPRGVLRLSHPNGNIDHEDSEGDVMKRRNNHHYQTTSSGGAPRTVSLGKGLVGTAALTAQPRTSVDIIPETPAHSIEILCMPVMLRARSNTTAVWHDSKRLEVGDYDDLESEDVEVLGVLRLSRVSPFNKESGGNLEEEEEDLDVGFTGDDARVVATFCGQVALSLSALQRRIALCHKLEEVEREKTTRVIPRVNCKDVMTKESRRLRARLNVAEARLIARKKRVTGEKPGRWGHNVERKLFYEKHIATLIEKQRAMQSTAVSLNSENTKLRSDLEKERKEHAQDKEKEQRLLPVLLGLRQLHEIDTKCVEKHKRQKKGNVR